MAGILQELLQAKEPVFSLAVRQLEAASGHESKDTRLIAEISAKMRGNILALGLDPDDTTGRELYAAQMVRVGEDNRRIAKLLGGDSPDNVAQMTPLVVKAIQESNIPRECWVLKRPVAKKILRSMPPKKLMKHLGYRSLDSMLKHENIAEVYAALRFSEGQEWLNAFNGQFKVLTPGDFETREISVIVMDRDKYAGLGERFVEKTLHAVAHSKEMGAIAVVPVTVGQVRGFALTTLLLLLHYINEIRLYSAFFKLKQVLPDFSEIVVKTLIADPASAAEMAGQYVHWRVIQRYYGDLDNNANHPEEFEPHIQPEDLRWRRAEEVLMTIDPEMKFWHGQDYVGKIYDDRTLTFNLMDIALSYSNDKTYETFYPRHFRENLWNELFSRYMGSKNLQYQVLAQLDHGVIAPEELLV